METRHPQNTNPCKSMKLRMIIGGWPDYYVNHGDQWAAFNVHGVRVTAIDDNDDYITFNWDFITLRIPTGMIIKAMSMINGWLKV